MSDSTVFRDCSGLKFRPPAFDAAGLRLVDEVISAPVVRVIRNGALAFSETQDWSRGYSALESTFVLNRQPHFFRAEPVVWAEFTEPQFTKGFAYFLDMPTFRNRRIRALLAALGEAELCKDMRDPTVKAEASIAGKKRVDLLIEWKDSSKERYAVAIEAKLGHHVAVGQLPAYRRHLMKKVSRERLCLVVVSPRRTDRTDKSLRYNRDWRWMGWRTLLVGHERVLPVECDDDAYLQFRKTLWDQTG